MRSKRLGNGTAFGLLLVLLHLSCKKDPETIPNQPPLAIGGSDRTILLPQDSVHLDGSASTDSDGTITSYKWDKIGGPAQLMIMSANTAKTAVTRLEAGVYLFQLTVSDNSGASALDTVQVTVNIPLVAKAGPDQQLILPISTVTLDGSASLSPAGTTKAWLWTQVAGPVATTLQTPTAARTLVTGLTEGVYQFELQVTDNLGHSAKDTVQVTVSLAPCNETRVNVVSGPGELKEFGSLSLARSFLVSAAVADKMVFAGGGNNDNYNYIPSDWVDIYNFTTKAWSTAQLSNSDIYQHVTVGNKILFISYRGSIDVYDAAANSWTVLSATPVVERYLPSIAVLGSKVFFAGGFVNGAPSSEVNIYDVAANSWSNAQLSEGRAGMNTVAVGNKLVFAGGFKRIGWDEEIEDHTKRIDIYDGTTNTWSTADLPQPAFYGSAAVIGNKAVFSFENLDKVAIYDATNNQLSVATLSLPRLGTKVASVGDKILVAGGYVANVGYSSRVDIYDASTGGWSVADMNRPGSVAWFVGVGNKLLLSFFNQDGSVNGSVFDVYDAGSNTFTAVELSHQFYATPVVANGQVYFGGAVVSSIGGIVSHSSCKVWQFVFK